MHIHRLANSCVKVGLYPCWKVHHWSETMTVSHMFCRILLYSKWSVTIIVLFQLRSLNDRPRFTPLEWRSSHLRCKIFQSSIQAIDIMYKFYQVNLGAVAFVPRDAMRKRGLCCRAVSACLSVRQVRVLYPWRLKISSKFFLGPVAPSF